MVYHLGNTELSFTVKGSWFQNSFFLVLDRYGNVFDYEVQGNAGVDKKLKHLSCLVAVFSLCQHTSVAQSKDR